MRECWVCGVTQPVPQVCGRECLPDNEPGERWATIPSHPLYMASSKGRIYSKPRVVTEASGRRRRLGGRILTPNPTGNKHLYVTISYGGARKYCQVHVLIAEAFLGPRPDGMVVCHYNDEPTDNRLGNLRYASQSDNLYDATRNGRNHNANKTHCPSGHPYSGDNLRFGSRGNGNRFRRCHTCRSEKNISLNDNTELELADHYERTDHE